MPTFTLSRWSVVSPVLLLVLVSAAASPVRAEVTPPALPQEILDTTYVPPAGATIVLNEGADLQKALDTAQAGDQIVLQAGATFGGNFVLRNKTSGSGWITLRSSRMEALPPGKRVRPSDAPAMARIVTSNSAPALTAEPGAHHYRIMGLEIAVAPKVPLNYITVSLGSPPTADLIASNIIFDRVWVHGSVLCHCKSGIALNGRRAAVIDSYISDYHGLGQDTQAIIAYSGPGPYKIVNNYLEASGENVMFGGSPTSIAGLVPSDIEFWRNYLTKSPSWRSSIIPPPQSLQAAAVSYGALDSGGTYYYTVVAVGPGGSINDMRSDPAGEVAVSLSVAGRGVSLSWAPLRYGDAFDDRTPAEYRVYRTADPPAVVSRNWVWFSVPGSGAPAFTDAGQAGSTGAPAKGHRWLVKNLLEFKNAQRVLIDSNVLEYSWLSGQVGWAILVSPRTQSGVMPWAVAQDLTFTNNVVRHAGGVVQLTGIDSYCKANPSVTCTQSSRILLRNNLFQDISAERWGGRGWLFQIYNSNALVIERNTGLNDRQSMWLGSGPNPGLTITGNIMFGDVGGDGAIGGNGTFARYAPEIRFTGNLLVGAQAARYSQVPGNYFAANAAEAGFVDAASDCRLKSGSPFLGVLPDGTDPGANVASVEKAVAGVVSDGADPGANVASAEKAVAGVVLPCDLNGDGAANILDVQIATTQVIRVSSCGNADLDQNAVCNWVDVQRLIDAANGKTCKVGP